MEIFEATYQWFMGLSTNYGVNPFIFGAIYVGAIPFFTISVAFILRNYKQKRPITLPVISASSFFVSSYVYLMIAGENVPWWVYAVVVLLLIFGGWSTYSNIKRKIKIEEIE